MTENFVAGIVIVDLDRGRLTATRPYVSEDVLLDTSCSCAVVTAALITNNIASDSARTAIEDVISFMALSSLLNVFDEIKPRFLFHQHLLAVCNCRKLLRTENPFVLALIMHPFLSVVNRLRCNKSSEILTGICFHWSFAIQALIHRQVLTQPLDIQPRLGRG